METQKLLNAPLHAFAASCAATHGWGGAYSASWIWTRFLHPEMRKPFFAMDPCYPGHLYMIAFSWTCGMVVGGGSDIATPTNPPKVLRRQTKGSNIRGKMRTEWDSRERRFKH